MTNFLKKFALYVSLAAGYTFILAIALGITEMFPILFYVVAVDQGASWYVAWGIFGITSVIALCVAVTIYLNSGKNETDQKLL